MSFEVKSEYGNWSSNAQSVLERVIGFGFLVKLILMISLI